MEEQWTAEQYREAGKLLIRESDPAAQKQGFDYILKAFRAKDPEAMYLVGVGILNRKYKTDAKDRTEYALSLIETASTHGIPEARSFLNEFCRERYDRTLQAEAPGKGGTGPLRGFDGKIFSINRTGLRTPIDAVLSYENGRNILRLSADVNFAFTEELKDPQSFENAVIRGIKDWEGDYTVFGGQPLTVRISLTFGQKLYDSVIVLPVAKSLNRLVQNHPNNPMKQTIDEKRSFIIAGLGKWSVTSRKIIYVNCEDFEDSDEVRDVTKHEFGHALGLGDLYLEEGIFEGVAKGSFRELDPYHIVNKTYFLVMCDHHGPISNNDIEMVLLAFYENRVQQYQAKGKNKSISIALGQGD